MKVIYMEQTLNLLAQNNGIDSVNLLLKSGKIKQTKEIKYLTIQ